MPWHTGRARRPCRAAHRFANTDCGSPGRFALPDATAHSVGRGVPAEPHTGPQQHLQAHRGRFALPKGFRGTSGRARRPCRAASPVREHRLWLTGDGSPYPRVFVEHPVGRGVPAEPLHRFANTDCASTGDGSPYPRVFVEHPVGRGRPCRAASPVRNTACKHRGRFALPEGFRGTSGRARRPRRAA